MSMENQAPAAEEKSNSKLWEDVDLETLRKEFSSMRDDLSSLGAEMEKLAKEAKNYEKTKEMLELVRDKDFSSSGWISSFIAENTTYFPSLNGNGSNKANMPDWYYALLPDKKKRYDDVLNYMDDAVKISGFFRPFADVLRELPLADTFRIFKIIKNMKERGWNEAEYKNINDDIEATCNLLKQSWGELDRKAPLSEKFYRENESKMDSPKMKEGYIKARQEDYANIVKTYVISSSILYKGNGKYSCLGERAASMKVLDKYMGRIVSHKDIGDKLTALSTKLETLANSLMSNIVLNTGSGKTLHQGLVNLVVVVRFFVTCSLEEFKKFREGSDEAPYCYMKCPEKTNLAGGWFGFNPNWGDSWSKGTDYLNIYRSILACVYYQGKDFAYLWGKVK
jgi:hypothetical protein